MIPRSDTTGLLASRRQRDLAARSERRLAEIRADFANLGREVWANEKSWTGAAKFLLDLLDSLPASSETTP